MFRNYLKIAYRHISRHKGYSFINVAGLAIGMAVCLIIFMYNSYELSFDNYHQDPDRIFRVALKSQTQTELRYSARVAAPVGPAIEESFPQVETVSRVLPLGSGLVRYEDNSFYENHRVLADSKIFSVLSIPFLLGNSKTALDRPNTVVISEEISSKFFGSENPLGKIIKVNSSDYEITGVVKNSPSNTHFEYAVFLSLETVADRYPFSEWFLGNFYIYLKAAPNCDMAALSQQLENMAEKYIGEELKKTGEQVTLFLQPVKDIHLYSHLRNEYGKEGNPKLLAVLSAIGLLILLIACINFINLSTARSVNRAKEVGMRKVIGGNRSELMKQFLGESLFLASFASLFALAIVWLILPFANHIASNIFISENLFRPGIILVLTGITLFTGFSAGIYPAFVLSSFQPVQALKGTFHSSQRGILLRKILVVSQFAISIALIIGTMIILKQVNYMKNKPLGFKKEQKLILPVRVSRLAENYETVKSEFSKVPGVSGVTISSDIPGRSDMNFWEIRVAGGGQEKTFAMHFLYVDYDYLTNYQIKLLAGRSFQKETTTDISEAYILNARAVETFGWNSPEEAVGKQIEMEGYPPRQIIGVTDNFHFKGVQQVIEPLVFEFNPRQFDYINLTLGTDEFRETMAAVGTKWKELYPQHPYEYFFLDEDFNRQYQREEIFGTIVTVLAFLGIFIAAIGLLGLSTFMTVQRTKEIGVRKVMGASSFSILILLTMQFIKWVILANIIAWPAAWYFLNLWLNEFAYRVSPGSGIYILAGLTTILIAFATVSWQALRSASSNPVEALRYE